MLRNLVLGLAGVMTVCGAVLTAIVWPAGIQLLVFGGLLLAGTLFERVVYKRTVAQPPASRFERTPERFRDPSTGEVLTVWADPVTGERSYVRE